MGHSLHGISEGYLSRTMLRGLLRDAQAKISRRIVALLRIT
jgi:hypothetical protein